MQFNAVLTNRSKFFGESSSAIVLLEVFQFWFFFKLIVVLLSLLHFMLREFVMFGKVHELVILLLHKAPNQCEWEQPENLFSQCYSIEFCCNSQYFTRWIISGNFLWRSNNFMRGVNGSVNFARVFWVQENVELILFPTKWFNAFEPVSNKLWQL